VAALADRGLDQIAATGALIAQRPRTAAEVGASFARARRELVQRHLETLELMGEIVRGDDGAYRSERRAARPPLQSQA